MLNNEALKVKIRKQLCSLNLDSEKEDKLVRELNYVSGLVIELYLMEKANGQQKTTHS